LGDPAWAEFAPAKVNLFLHVISRRDDGYHILDSLAVFAAIGDRLRAKPADRLTLRVEGPFAAALQPEADNLVLRAARTLADAAGIAPRAHLVLDKMLPVASGIGGGSADAAATLRLLSQLWGLPDEPDRLAGIAASLGADVPVCLAGEPRRMGGVGEVLRPAPVLPPCGLALVNPGVAVSTPSVFRARSGAFSSPASLPERWPDAAALAATLRGLRNDLEAPAIQLQPVIAEAIDALAASPGCLLARMSGSGATCYGLFEDPAAAAAAAAALQPSSWWRWGGALHAGWRLYPAR